MQRFFSLEAFHAERKASRKAGWRKPFVPSVILRKKRQGTEAFSARTAGGAEPADPRTSVKTRTGEGYPTNSETGAAWESNRAMRTNPGRLESNLSAP